MKFVFLIVIAVMPLRASAETPKFAPPQTEATLVRFPGGPVMVIPPPSAFWKRGTLVSLTNFGRPFAGVIFPKLLQLEESTSQNKDTSESQSMATPEPKTVLRNPFQARGQDVFAAFLNDCLTMTRFWPKNSRDFKGGCFGEVLISTGISFESLTAHSGVPDVPFDVVDYSDSTVELLVRSVHRTDATSLLDRVVGRDFSDIDDALSKLATRVGHWENVDSPFGWTFYEVELTTWIVAVNSRTSEVRIFTAYSLSKWPKEIAISNDLFSLESKRPQLDSVESVVDVPSHLGLWITPTGESSDNDNRSSLQFYFDGSEPSAIRYACIWW